MVRNGKRRSFPITYLFPNIITMAGLCAGLSAVRFAMIDRWEMAVGLLLLAAMLDAMDGRLARMLNATSTFGAQLDSLADFISFGVAPALVIYLWQLHDVRGLGWIVVLFFAVCCALRLARFNTQIFEADEKSEDSGEENYFTGVPAPAGALLCVLPLVLHLEFGPGLFDDPMICLIYVPFIALLMASTLPTFSAKKFKIRSSYAGPFMALSGLWIAGWIIEPWLTFAISAGLYVALIPVAVRRYYLHKSADEDA